MATAAFSFSKALAAKAEQQQAELQAATQQRAEQRAHFVVRFFVFYCEAWDWNVPHGQTELATNFFPEELGLPWLGTHRVEPLVLQRALALLFPFVSLPNMAKASFLCFLVSDTLGRLTRSEQFLVLQLLKEFYLEPR